MININKSKWREVNIGFIADEINIKVISPEKSGCEKFIRPEDLEIGELLIKKFRSPEDVGSGKFCYTGDIIFARRSVSVSQFKRRASVLTFDAVCSDELTVIREREKEITKGFLNLVLNTTKLWDYAISKSVGSVSKRIKWEDLAKYSFLLPSPTEQTQIAELFQSIETAIEQAEQQEKNLRALQSTLSNGLVNTQPTFGNLLNKKNCTPTNFGGVADCIEQHDKQKKDVSRFIGLENIEPENLKISTWGNIADGTTFTKRFYKGDVLFGKRRAYLKKVAVAEFDGICSGDIFVLRAKEKKMLPELLPFYVSAEAFIQHAVHTSAGSLSPRTKWKDLSSFEIAIPDLKTQENIFEVFRQIQITLEEIKTQKQTLKNLKQKLLNEILG
ncbi:MAG: restriction endonuclease subunit S [Candidatus Brocadiaceae bacterium]|nr:restriction endonuclease subunit S [Candidatus Brocadiaceae bacterium]